MTVDRCAVPADASGDGSSELLGGDAELLKDGCGASGPAMRRPVRSSHDVGEFDVVHDDEVVEVGEEAGELVAVGFEQDASRRSSEGGEVALDAALGVEDEVVVALAGGEVLDGVGDHAVEPADAVAPVTRIQPVSSSGAMAAPVSRAASCGWPAGLAVGVDGGLERGGHIGSGAKLRTLLIIATGYGGCAEV